MPWMGEMWSELLWIVLETSEVKWIVEKIRAREYTHDKSSTRIFKFRDERPGRWGMKVVSRRLPTSQHHFVGLRSKTLERD